MSTNVVEKKAKEQWVPHTYLIIFGLLIIAAILTWIIPAGVYNRVLDPATGRQMIQPTTFHFIPSTSVGLFDFFMAIQKGMVNAANIMVFIFIVGGTFGIFNATGAMNRAIAKIVGKFSGKSYEYGIFIIITGFFYACVALSGLTGTLTLGFVPFFVVVCKSLGYDAILASAMVLFAVTMGNTGSIANPFNIGIAQAVAGLPIYSGAWYRAIISVVIFTISMGYMLRYARKIKKDPSKSLVADIDYSHIQSIEDPSKVILTAKDKRILTVFFGFFIFMLFGVLKWKFAMAEMTALFLGLGFMIGIVGRLKLNEFCERFVDGARELLYGALLVGLAMGIQQVMVMGNIMDSLIYFLVKPLELIPRLLIGPVMVFVQSIINLIIPSSSAMAVVSMPIMTPLADILHIQRQTAVIAFQFGDGITNLIQPTWDTGMIVLGMAAVPFTRWIKFTSPLVAILLIVAFIMTGIAELIQVGPF